MLLHPKEIVVPTQDGEDRTYIISKFPASAGREILTQYSFSSMPKVGDYAVNEALMFKIMGYVGVRVPGRETPIMLATKALVDNHVPDWETLTRIEEAILEYNTSFFSDGRTSTFSAALNAMVLPKLIGTLTGSLEKLLQAAGQPSTT